MKSNAKITIITALKQLRSTQTVMVDQGLEIKTRNKSYTETIMKVSIHYQRRILTNLLFSSGSTADHVKKHAKTLKEED